MRSIIQIAFVIGVLLLSGCIGNFNLPFAQANFITKQEVLTDDIGYAIQVYPTEVMPGEDLRIRVKILPKKDITNVKVKILDTCDFTCKDGECEKEISRISANSQRMVRFTLAAPESVVMEKDCEIRFAINYTANATIIRDLVVLSKTEYAERAKKGTLNEIKINEIKVPSSLDLDLKFSQSEALRSGEKVYMTINYRNKGSGVIDTLEKGSVVIEFPGNVKDENCDDYVKKSDNDNLYELDKNIKFYGKESEKSVCEFTVNAKKPVDIQKMRITAKYKYETEDYIIVKLLKG